MKTTACSTDREPATPAQGSGIDLQYIDHSVRPQDHFFRHVNGVWLDNTEIPADKGRYGSFDKLNDDSLESLRGLIEQLHSSVDAADASSRWRPNSPALQRSGASAKSLR